MAETQTEIGGTDGAFVSATVVRVEPVAPETTCAEVYDMYRASPDLVAIPVVEGTRPIGLVNRYDLTMSLAQDFGRALYAKKPITVRMDPQPLVVESNLAVDELEWMIAANSPSALTRGFIVVKRGEYLGVGTALTLLTLGMARTTARAQQFEEARATAEAANRSKSRFLATMSHELRTPLNAILGFSDFIRNEILGPIGLDRYREYVNDIHTSAQSLLVLINDILDTARIDAGKMELFEESLDLTQVVDGVLRIMAERARQNNVCLEKDVATSTERLFADRRAITQILLNLLSNAIKFAPGGSVCTGVRRHADGMALWVRDSGIGMSPREIEIALTPFGQVANEHTRNHDGSGLGLPLVNNLIQLHGGHLKIESAPARGTTVTVVFPASRVVTETNQQYTAAAPVGIPAPDHKAAATVRARLAEETDLLV